MPAPRDSLLYPPSGTIIDGGALQLFEILSDRGYDGVVYRAVDPGQPIGQQTYAVKCFLTSVLRTARHQRQNHMQTIKLHLLVSAHPSVVTLHRVVEKGNHIYVVMEYATGHSLFTQIFRNGLYLGDDTLIKVVFLQLIDVVEYCHCFGIYLRNLNPTNIATFQGGFRIALTDFSLATIDKLREDLCVGNDVYMSPECGGVATMGKHSPRFTDVWSLGILLLNIITGRNPWRFAAREDPTFETYLSDPFGFLITVFPISSEVNEILIAMLHVNWHERMALHEVREALEKITNFYSDDVVFEGCMAYRPWEIDLMEYMYDKTPAAEKMGSPVNPTPENLVPTAIHSTTTQARASMYSDSTQVTELQPVHDKVSLDTGQNTLRGKPPLLSPQRQKFSNMATAIQNQTTARSSPQPVNSSDSALSTSKLHSDSVSLLSSPSVVTFYSNPHSSVETLEYGLYYTRHAISQDSMSLLVGW